MRDSKRLKIIKGTPYLITCDVLLKDFKWLVGQVESLEKLETGIKHLQYSNEDLERRIKLLREIRTIVASAHQENLEIKEKENAKLRKALTFYANEETYKQKQCYLGDGHVETSEEPIVNDKGQIAKIALEDKP